MSRPAPEEEAAGRPDPGAAPAPEDAAPGARGDGIAGTDHTADATNPALTDAPSDDRDEHDEQNDQSGAPAMMPD